MASLADRRCAAFLPAPPSSSFVCVVCSPSARPVRAQCRQAVRAESGLRFAFPRRRDGRPCRRGHAARSLVAMAARGARVPIHIHLLRISPPIVPIHTTPIIYRPMGPGVRGTLAGPAAPRWLIEGSSLGPGGMATRGKAREGGGTQAGLFVQICTQNRTLLCEISYKLVRKARMRRIV